MMLQKKTKAMIFNSIARSENQQLTSCLTIDLHFEKKKGTCQDSWPLKELNTFIIFT